MRAQPVDGVLEYALPRYAFLSTLNRGRDNPLLSFLAQREDLSVQEGSEARFHPSTSSGALERLN